MKEEKKSKNDENLDTMSDNEMKSLLLELSDTRQWYAILRYVAIRSQATDDGLRSTDPFKEPTLMARTQGIRAGIWDIIVYVNEERERLKKGGEKEEKKKNK